MSSLSFIGNQTSYISIPNNVGLNFETQDFTVEWFQYQTDTNSFPRIFQKGTYSSTNISIGVSIEGGHLYYWRNTTPYQVIVLNSNQYKNKWVHFAICRSSGVTTIYMNGTSIFTLADTYNYTNTENLLVANESSLSSNAAFGGYMYYFHYVKGIAKYTANFTVSTDVPAVLPETILLLTASSFSGTLGNTVTSTAGTFVITPTLSGTNQSSSSILTSDLRPLFTDNSRIYYKPNTLASGGVGSVRNHRKKARRT
jgi:hypothetical protein